MPKRLTRWPRELFGQQGEADNGKVELIAAEPVDDSVHACCLSPQPVRVGRTEVTVQSDGAAIVEIPVNFRTHPASVSGEPADACLAMQSASPGLAKTRVRVSLDVWPEMFNVWHMHHDRIPERRKALDDAARFLLEALPSR